MEGGVAGGVEGWRDGAMEEGAAELPDRKDTERGEGGRRFS